jgi:hypothetical protein
MHADGLDEDETRVANMRAGVVKTVIAAQLRVDEHSLRRKQLDVLPKLLAEMEAQRALLLLDA